MIKRYCDLCENKCKLTKKHGRTEDLYFIYAEYEFYKSKDTMDACPACMDEFRSVVYEWIKSKIGIRKTK